MKKTCLHTTLLNPYQTTLYNTFKELKTPCFIYDCEENRQGYCFNNGRNEKVLRKLIGGSVSDFSEKTLEETEWKRLCPKYH